MSVYAHPHLWGIIHFFRWCAWVCFYSSIINCCLVGEEMFDAHPRLKRWYLHAVSVNCMLAINLREEQPSLGVLRVIGRIRDREHKDGQ